MSNRSNVCQKCGSNLEERQCKACQGRGQIRQLLFWKEPCTVCNGLGQVYKCPNAFNHSRYRKPKNRSTSYSRLKIENQSPINPHTVKSFQCLICSGKGILTSSGTKCPRCGGKGRIFESPKKWTPSYSGSKFGSDSSTKIPTIKIPPQKCSLCGGAGGVRAPSGQAGPCPRCGGRGSY